MFLALGLVLSSVLAADDKTPPETPVLLATPATSAAPMVLYEVRFVRAPSLDWRASFADRLHLVTRHEGASVWDVDEATLYEIMDLFEGDERDNHLPPLFATVELDQSVDLSMRYRQEYVAEMSPETVREKAVDGAEVVRTSFTPETATLDLGPIVRVKSSQLVGMGVQAALSFEDRRLVAMHATTREGVEEERREFAVPVLSKIPIVGNRLFRNIGIGRRSISARVEVPEVSTARVEGEWLVPSEGALVVSLGPTSTGDGQPVGERLVILTARLLPVEPVAGP